MRFIKKKKNSIQSRPPRSGKKQPGPLSTKELNNHKSDEVLSMKSGASETSSQLQLLTKKHSFNSRNLSFSKSKRTKDVVTFTVAIESIDGIISTKTGRQSNLGQRSQPIFAVISYYKKVVSTGNVVKTNILSLPIVKSNSSFGNRDRYYAKFSDSEEESQIFELSAAMENDNNSKSGYIPRELDLEVSLMRGSDVLKIGSATLVLNGDEDGSLQLVSVNTEKAVTNTLRKAMTANKPSRTNSSSSTTTGAKSVSFSSDPTQKYTLQRSIMRLSISIQDENNEASSNYLQDRSKGVPSSMILSIGQSDSISCLSIGGVTTQVIKNIDKPVERTRRNAVQKLKSSKTETTEDFTYCTTESSRADDYTAASEIQTQALRELNGIHCGHEGFRLLTNTDNYSSGESDSDSDSDSDDESFSGKEESTKIPSFTSEETESAVPFTFSEDSELLEEVSIGTIRFKDIESTGGGFEVNLKEGKKVRRTVSDILG